MSDKEKKLEHIQVKDNGIKISQKVGDALATAKQLLERDCFKGLLQGSDETSMLRYRIAQNTALENYRKTTKEVIKNAKNEVKQALKEDKTVNLNNKQVAKISGEVNKGLLYLGADAMQAYQSTLRDVILKVKSASDLKEQLGKHIASGLNLGVTYKDGKTYQFDTYFEMKARTDIQQEIGKNMISSGQASGVIFYITSFYGDCAPDHADYQGKIYVDKNWESMAPKDRLEEIKNYIASNKVLTVQEVTENKPFLTTRPNCRHYFQYIDIDSVLGAKTPDDVSKLRDERNLNFGGKYKPDKYKALQQQRLNERKIRAYKADMEKKQISLALEPDNQQLKSEIEIDKSNIRMYQKAQRDLAKQYSNIERRYDREKVGNRVDFGDMKNNVHYANVEMIEKEKQNSFSSNNLSVKFDDKMSHDLAKAGLNKTEIRKMKGAFKFLFGQKAVDGEDYIVETNESGVILVKDEKGNYTVYTGFGEKNEIDMRNLVDKNGNKVIDLDLNGKKIISGHSHPNGTPPSVGDIISANNRTHLDIKNVILGNEGSSYSYVVTKKIDIDTILRYAKEEDELVQSNASIEARTELIERMAKECGFSFKILRKGGKYES